MKYNHGVSHWIRMTKNVHLHLFEQVIEEGRVAEIDAGLPMSCEDSLYSNIYLYVAL